MSEEAVEYKDGQETLKEKLFEWLDVQMVDSVLQEANEFHDEVSGNNDSANLPSIEEAYGEAFEVINDNLTVEQVEEYLKSAEVIVPQIIAMMKRYEELRSVGDGGFISDNLPQ